MAEKITFEESLGVEPEEFTLPLIRGYGDALVVYIPDKSSNIIMIPEKATSIDAYTFDLQDLKEIQDKMDIAQGKLVIGLDVELADYNSKFAVAMYNVILRRKRNIKIVPKR